MGATGSCIVSQELQLQVVCRLFVGIGSIHLASELACRVHVKRWFTAWRRQRILSAGDGTCSSLA